MLTVAALRCQVWVLGGYHHCLRMDQTLLLLFVSGLVCRAWQRQAFKHVSWAYLQFEEKTSSVYPLEKKIAVVTVVTVISLPADTDFWLVSTAVVKCFTCMTVANRAWITFSKSSRLPLCPRAWLALPSPGRCLSNSVFKISSDGEGNVSPCHSCCLFHSLQREMDGISIQFLYSLV